MANILFVADIHIKLGQKNVPRQWQYNRIIQLAEELNQVECDYVVIGGDLLDIAKPSIEEVGLLYDFLLTLNKTGYIIPGNHEMQTKTRDCFVHIDNMLKSLGFSVIREFDTIDGIDYIPYNILNGVWEETNSTMAITHVRGEIPPHVQPEINLERFSNYDKVFAGDLHSLSNSQLNIHYPGSPFSTSFHRSVPSNTNGFFNIDTISGDFEWVELHLPQLIRKAITDIDDMVVTDYHHTIYELEGSLEELAKVKDSTLLDKKITKDISAPATLNLTGGLVEELTEYLQSIEDLTEEEIGDYIKLFKENYSDTD